MSACFARTDTAARFFPDDGTRSAALHAVHVVGSFERNVLSSARKLKEKGIETGKRDADEVPLVEGAPNYNAADVAEIDALEDGRDSGAEAAE